MVRGQYAQLMAPGIHHIFNQWMDTYQRDLEYPAIFNIENSTKAYEDDVEFAGTPPAPEKPENTPVVYTQFVQGGTKRYVHLTYALGARVSFELYDDDQYGLTKQIPKALARSMRFTEEMVAWNVFNQGFSTVKTIDGLSLFNNQHPLLGGPAATNIGPGLSAVISAAGTYPNRPAVDVDLSYAAVQLMTNQFERLVDAMGMPIVYKPKALLIAPANRFLARELLGSPGKPGTATNEINSLLGEDLGYMISHYLQSDTAWYALCDKSMHQLRFFRRKAVDMDMDDDFDTDALKQKTKTRFSVGASHWLGTWGSNGP
jgi:Mu-like prophage major head subunit gpT